MDLNVLLSEHGLAVVIIFILFGSIAYFGKWFLNIYTHKLTTQFSELNREIAEVKVEVLEMRKFKVESIRLIKPFSSKGKLTETN